MAHHHINGNHNTNHNSHSTIITMSSNNPIPKDRYDYEMMGLTDQERQYMIAQQLSREKVASAVQENQYLPTMSDIYTNMPQLRATSHSNRRPRSMIIPDQMSPVKPLRIVIIRHAERADAVLGSEWSKKSFDRRGRYIQFSEHLPVALPTRSYLHHYVIDVPLTNRGRMHAFRTGRSLLGNGYEADICYTSPSLRCVQSADKILSGMGRKGVAMQLEPGLFECYLNDFKRTLCFMTKDELIANGYNIDRSYQALMPFMRPHDSQMDYYERCQTIMDIITKRHQATGGTILIVAHAPSLEGLTRHFSGGKYLPEKLFDIARRVPFLAMTILEKNGIDGPWLFRTQPLQTGQSESKRDIDIEISLPTTVAMGQSHSMTHHGQQQLGRHQQQHNQYQHSSHISPPSVYAQYSQHRQQPPPRIPQTENVRHSVPLGMMSIDPKKVAKSSTAPDLPTNNSFSEMFHVI